VSKRVDGTYRSGPCPVWIKVRNPASIVVQRERSENLEQISVDFIGLCQANDNSWRTIQIAYRGVPIGTARTPILIPQLDLFRPNRRGFSRYCHDVVCSHRILATTSSPRGAAPSPRNACCRRVTRLRRSNIAWPGIPRWNVGGFSRRRARHRTPRAHESGHAYNHDRSYPHHRRWPAGAYDRAKIDATFSSPMSGLRPPGTPPLRPALASQVWGCQTGLALRRPLLIRNGLPRGAGARLPAQLPPASATDTRHRQRC
jgi:hypothetical protein